MEANDKPAPVDMKKNKEVDDRNKSTKLKFGKERAEANKKDPNVRLDTTPGVSAVGMHDSRPDEAKVEGGESSEWESGDEAIKE